MNLENVKVQTQSGTPIITNATAEETVDSSEILVSGNVEVGQELTKGDTYLISNEGSPSINTNGRYEGVQSDAYLFRNVL